MVVSVQTEETAHFISLFCFLSLFSKDEKVSLFRNDEKPNKQQDCTWPCMNTPFICLQKWKTSFNRMESFCQYSGPDSKSNKHSENFLRNLNRYKARERNYYLANLSESFWYWLKTNKQQQHKKQKTNSLKIQFSQNSGNFSVGNDVLYKL